MPATRTDVHSPRNLITEDYTYFDSGYFGSAGEPGYSPLAHPHGQALLADGWHFGDNESAGGCYHCGHRVKYWALLLHNPTHTIIRVGEKCCERFDIPTVQFQALRKQAQLDRKRQRVVRLRRTWFAVDPDREIAFGWATAMVSDGDYGYNGMRHNFVSSINRYGSTSDRFVRAIMRDMARTERFAEERAAQKALEAATAAPVVEGRVQVTGEVLSVKVKDNDFGSRLVMTVRDDRGFKVWGTVPSTLDLVERGERVTFTATLERSDRDETFGFFKRPAKATYVK